MSLVQSSDPSASNNNTPPTPKDLSIDIDTAAELSPYRKNIAQGDNSNQDLRADNYLESVLGLRKREGQKTDHDITQIMCGCMFAYTVLGIWVWTVIQFMFLINHHDCSTAYTDLGESYGAFEDATATMSCLDVFTGSLACAHSITFGLISAVVIHEMGSADTSSKHRLTSLIQPLLARRKSNANFIQRNFRAIITSLPTMYVVSWTVFGLTCFVYSLSMPDGSVSTSVWEQRDFDFSSVA